MEICISLVADKSLFTQSTSARRFNDQYLVIILLLTNAIISLKNNLLQKRAPGFSSFYHLLLFQFLFLKNEDAIVEY